MSYCLSRMGRIIMRTLTPTAAAAAFIVVTALIVPAASQARPQNQHIRQYLVIAKQRAIHNALPRKGAHKQPGIRTQRTRQTTIVQEL